MQGHSGPIHRKAVEASRLWRSTAGCGVGWLWRKYPTEDTTSEDDVQVMNPVSSDNVSYGRRAPSVS